jgi:hypothetical protein
MSLNEPPLGTTQWPIEDLYLYEDDPIDYMSAESFPASDPPPPPSAITPSADAPEGDGP